MDHDQRFKILIQTFFQEFLLLFFLRWAERLDTSAVEWLDKEIFPDPPEGSRHTLDLVAKLPTREMVKGQRLGEPDHWLALVHIEIESPDKATPLRPRMCDAYFQLRQRHGLPVLPIGVFLNVGLEGVGTDVYEEHFWELHTNRFEYLYVGLPALDGLEYVQGDNWLGVALSASMKIPKDRVAWLGAEALRRLQAAPLTDQQRFLLADCVQAYLPMDESQRQKFERLLDTATYHGVKAMNTTWYEKGIEKGMVQGAEKERREWVRKLLEKRFGPLTPVVTAHLEQLSAERLLTLSQEAWTAQSLSELGLEA